MGPYSALGRVRATIAPGFHGPCSGPALTTRGHHAQQLVCPTWARARLSHAWARGSSDPLGHESVSEPGHLAPGRVSKALVRQRLLRSRVVRACAWPASGLMCCWAVVQAAAASVAMLGYICDRCDARVLMTSAACELSCEGVCCLQARRERRRCDPLRVLALSELPSSSVTVRDPAMGMAPRRLVVASLRAAGAAASAPPSNRGSGGREASSAPP